MPSIKIKELDSTRGGIGTTNTNIVYVPGFMSTDVSVDAQTKKATGAWPVKDGEVDHSLAAKKHTPILCSSVAEFEKYFGTQPFVFSFDGSYDKSYIYAKELLSLGLPVLYESVNDFEDNSDSLTRDTLYGALKDMYEALGDKGNYQLKYITSGGYPTYNVGPANGVEDRGELDDYTIYPENVKELNDGGSADFKLVRDGKAWELKDVTSKTNVITEGKFSGEVVGDSYIVYRNQFDTDSEQVVRKVIVAITPADYAFKTGDAFEFTITDVSGIQSVSNHKFTPVAAVVSSKYHRYLDTLAYTRGDCIALLDHDNNADIDIVDGLYAEVIEDVDGLAAADCCAMFTPWVSIDCATHKPFGLDADGKPNKSITFEMPPSFAYLAALAKSLQTNASWLAVAGATRGQIPGFGGLVLNHTLTNSMADAVQSRVATSINAITEIKPFGYRIWGNRTLKNNANEGDLTATSFLNTRNMICDVKKVVYEACKKYTFEQNNDVLWLNFKSEIEPTLNRMKTGAGISGYKIIKGDAEGQKAKLVATIKLYPLYAVEDFEITVQMLDEDIAVS